MVVNVNEFVIVLDRDQISSYDATPLLIRCHVSLAGLVYVFGAQASDWSKCAQNIKSDGIAAVYCCWSVLVSVSINCACRSPFLHLDHPCNLLLSPRQILLCSRCTGGQCSASPFFISSHLHQPLPQMVRVFTQKRGLALTHSLRNQVPSAASFYVSSLPDLHQDPLHPLHIYAGHLNADPGAARLPDTTVTSHLYFVLIKARRTADKERILFWFNVSTTCMPNMLRSSTRLT